MQELYIYPSSIRHVKKRYIQIQEFIDIYQIWQLCLGICQVKLHHVSMIRHNTTHTHDIHFGAKSWTHKWLWSLIVFQLEAYLTIYTCWHLQQCSRNMLVMLSVWFYRTWNDFVYLYNQNVMNEIYNIFLLLLLLFTKITSLKLFSPIYLLIIKSYIMHTWFGKIVYLRRIY